MFSYQGRDLNTYPLAPVVKSKLLKAGFRTSADFINLTPIELTKETGLTHDESLETLKIINEKLTTPSSLPSTTPTYASAPKTASELFEKEVNSKRIITFAESIDTMLGGGVPLGKVTEFCGVPGIGKTQMGIQLAVDVHLPEALGGVEGECIYIDTEGSCVPERVVQITEAFVQHVNALKEANNFSFTSPTLDSILSTIYYFRVHDFSEQIAIINTLPSLLQEHPNVKLIVVDSITFHFRTQFVDMSLRTKLLHSMAQSLMSVAESNNLAVVLINQVTTKIGDNNVGSQLIPALGESWGHACTNRIILHWRDKFRHAYLYKSPSQKPSSVKYQITQDGVRGVEE